MQFLDPYVFGVLSAIAATLLFGLTSIAYLKMSEDIGVMDIMFTRFWVSLPLAYFFAVGTLGTFEIVVPADTMFPLAVSMIVGVLVGDAMYLLSQERIGVSRAFPIANSYPLLVYAITAIYLGEPVILQRIIGAIITVVGVSMIARAGSADNQDEKSRWTEADKRIGFMLAFAAALGWACSDAIFQFGLINAGVVESNYFRTLVVSVILVPIFFVSLKGGIRRRKLPSKRVTAIALVIGLFGVGFSLIAYSYAIKFVGATVTAVIISTAPIFAAPISAIYLGEDINRRVAFGTILTIIGVFLVVVLF